MDEDLKQRMATLESDVDTLQNKALEKDAPFFKTSSFWISIGALVFSVATTLWSSVKADAQEMQASRQELRVLLQRLAALPKENLEASRKYATDQVAAQTIGSLINQENAILARQAAEITAKLSKAMVSSTEYYAVAMALENAYELGPTRRLLNLSIETAAERGDFASEIGARRGLAYLDFMTGKPDDGRNGYRAAKDIFARYPDFDQYTKVNTGFLTEMNWASAEAIARLPDQVRAHLDAAAALLTELPPSPGLDGMRQQIGFASAQFAAMGVLPKPLVPAMGIALPTPVESPVAN